MKTALLIGLGLVLAGIACNPELTLNEVLKGKSCRATAPFCVQPYVCNQRTKICVMPGELMDAGDSPGNVSDDLSLSPAAGGSSAQEVSTNHDPTVGGEGGAAGSGLSEAGAGGVSSADPAVGAADAGCIKQRLFLDRDGDGYGSTAPEDTKIDCPSAGWVDVGGDCLDAEVTAQNKANQVHPQQTEFFPEGYLLPSGDVSFDYDCSQQEDSDPSNTNLKAVDCSLGSVDTGCTAGIGLAPEERSGPHVNNLCGSSTLQTCTPQGNECVPGVRTGTRVFRCR